MLAVVLNTRDVERGIFPKIRMLTELDIGLDGVQSPVLSLEKEAQCHSGSHNDYTKRKVDGPCWVFVSLRPLETLSGCPAVTYPWYNVDHHFPDKDTVSILAQDFR